MLWGIKNVKNLTIAFVQAVGHSFFQIYYPTALKGCRGIVFTHGVRMGGRPGGRAAGKFVRAVSQKP